MLLRFFVWVQKTVAQGKAHPTKSFARIMQVNLLGAFRCLAFGAAGMTTLAPINKTDDERGVIINTASTAAFEGQKGQLAYAASKGGIVSMTLTAARDLGEKGIRVNTIAPGVFQTPLADHLPENAIEQLLSSVVYPKRFGQLPEFASLVRHICENIMLNGSIIRLDGVTRM